MSKDLNMSFLLDFYGDILSEPQREAMELFYNGDLSLSEISEITGITRQGVRDRLLKSEDIINGLETKLRLAERFGNIEKDIDYIVMRLKALSEEHGIDVSDIINAANGLREL